MAEWRVGRSTGRTLWRDEQLVGMVDSPEIALEIVAAMRVVERMVGQESGRERSHAEQAAGGRVCYCPECRTKRGDVS